MNAIKKVLATTLALSIGALSLAGCGGSGSSGGSGNAGSEAAGQTGEASSEGGAASSVPKSAEEVVVPEGESVSQEMDVVGAMNVDFTTMDPMDTSDTLSGGIQRLMMDGLFGFDDNMKIIPMLATDYEANENAIQEIEKIIKQEKIDCDFEKQPSYVFTNEQDEVEKIKLEVKAVNSIGGDSKFVEKTELPFPHLGAIVFPNQAMFHPVKYGKALAQKIIEQKRNDL